MAKDGKSITRATLCPVSIWLGRRAVHVTMNGRQAELSDDQAEQIAAWYGSQKVNPGEVVRLTLTNGAEVDIGHRPRL